MRAIVFLIIAASVSFAQNTTPQVPTPDERIATLEAKVAEMDKAVKAQDALWRVRLDTMAKKLEEQDAVYQRTLLRVAALCNEPSDQLGIVVPADLQKALDGLKDHKLDGRFGRRKQMEQISAKGRDAIGAVPVLIEVLQDDEDRFCRQYAARTIGTVCAGTQGTLARKAVAALNEAKNKDPDADVRSECLSAIRQILK